MFIGFFDFCQELMSGYKIWLIFTVIHSNSMYDTVEIWVCIHA